MNTQSQSYLFKGKELEVYSKRSGHNYSRARTMTFLVFDWLRNLVLILYKNKKGKIKFCGVADANIMKTRWGNMDIIQPNIVDGKVSSIIYHKENKTGSFSFFKAYLDGIGRYENMKHIIAHHISGNHYCHLSSNGILLNDHKHFLLHHNAGKEIRKGYEAFILHVKHAGVPALSECYENPEKVIRLSIKSDEEFKDDMIRFFCGSNKNYDELRNVLLEKTDSQTEKERHFSLIF